MANVIKCDGCGEVVQIETLMFDIEAFARRTGGNIITESGKAFEWDHKDEFGDLCGDCAEPVIKALNEALKQ